MESESDTTEELSSNKMISMCVCIKIQSKIISAVSDKIWNNSSKEGTMLLIWVGQKNFQD